MQAKSLFKSPVFWALLAVGCAGAVAAEDRGGDRRGDGRRHGGPNIIIEPNIDLSRRPRPNADAPDFVMAEIGRCNEAGIRLFVDCLRQNHSSIMIRRLEACLQSETIPDDQRRIAACIPLAPLP